MRDKKLETEIAELLGKILQVPADEIDAEASFSDTYAMDSLRVLEILAEVENYYHITIDPDKLMEMTSVSAVAEIVSEYLKDRGPE